jgi:hypothetical protein
MPSLADLMVTDFEPRGGETFRLRAPARELELTENRPRGRAAEREAPSNDWHII